MDTSSLSKISVLDLTDTPLSFIMSLFLTTTIFIALFYLKRWFKTLVGRACYTSFFQLRLPRPYTVLRLHTVTIYIQTPLIATPSKIYGLQTPLIKTIRPTSTDSISKDSTRRHCGPCPPYIEIDGVRGPAMGSDLCLCYYVRSL